MLDVQIAPNPTLRALLAKHPRVACLSESDGAPLCWVQDGHWRRRIWVGRSDIELKGLVELMDNNPLVCADEMSVPSPAATLALIALGPLARGGLIKVPPKLIYTSNANEQDISDFLATAGWADGAIVEARDLNSYQCRVVAEVDLTSAFILEEIEDLYAEAFCRSFFVQPCDETPRVDMVHGKPYALYSLGQEYLSEADRFEANPDDPNDFAYASVLADREGKCGAAQVVHAFNVMAGFEESLGL